MKYYNNTKFTLALLTSALITMACTPGDGSSDQQFTLTEIEAQTTNIDSDISLSTVTSPNVALNECSASNLPEGLSVAVSSDTMGCSITGSPTETSDNQMVAITGYSDNFEHTIEFSITIVPDQPFTLSAIDNQTVEITSSISINTTSSPNVSLNECNASNLPNGLSITVSPDSFGCVISGNSLESVTDQTVSITGSSTLNEDTIEFAITITNSLPIVEIPEDATFVFGEEITPLEMLSIGGKNITSCYLANIPDGLSYVVNDDATGCILTGTPEELLEMDARYFALYNSVGVGYDKINYEVIRPNTKPNLSNAGHLEAIQDNTIDDITLVNNDAGGGNLTSCHSEPALPDGLSVTADGDSCTISGASTVLVTDQSYTIVGTNEFGSDGATISITVSRDSARLTLDQDQVKAFLLKWNTVVKADHYSIYEKLGDEESTLLVTVGKDVAEYKRDITTLLDFPEAEYYMETCFDADKEECIVSDTKSSDPKLIKTIGFIKSSNPGIQDQFGSAIELSGDGKTMAVCAPNEESGSTGINGDQTDNSVDNAGAVYIFVDSGNNDWSQQAYIKSDAPIEDDRFCGRHIYRPWAASSAIALSDDGNTLAVGAVGSETVFVFERTGTTWAQTHKLTASNAGIDEFGRSIDMDAAGTRIIVGANKEDCKGTGINTCDGSDYAAGDGDYNSGAAYLFTKNETTGDWDQTAYIKNNVREYDGWFGYTVAISDDGETLAIGEFFGTHLPATSGQLDSGLVHLYDYKSTSDAWAFTEYVYASNRDDYTRFGTALDLNSDGTAIAIGAFAEDSAESGIGGTITESIVDNNGAGATYVFNRADKFSSWGETVYIKPEKLAIAKAFGISVELSDDGSELFVGAYGDMSTSRGINADNTQLDADSARLYGAVYHYTLDTAVWGLTNYIKAGGSGQIGFGFGMALSNDTSVLAVGAPGESTSNTGINGSSTSQNTNYAGAVFLY